MNHLARFAFWTLAVTSLVLPWTHAQEKPKKEEPAPKDLTVMKRKLTHAQGVLDGLALQDFDKITKHADGLIEARKDATWLINDTEAYLRYSNTFSEHLQKMKKAAKDKNIDSATLAYLDMTLTCVKCHEHLRSTKRKRVDD
jgi:hypothetical protein